MITLAAEQFGTHIRATVATTVPSFIRALIIPITAGFNLLRPRVGLLPASAIVGAVGFAVAFVCASRLDETFGKDLDYSD